jgi:hypothetical protein
MKTIKFILLLILSAGQIQAQTKTREEAQEPMHYKSLSSFKSNMQVSDTLQYLEYNFVERKSQYKGKTVSDVIREIRLPVNYIVEYAKKMGLDADDTPSTLYSISLGIKQLGKETSPLEDYYVVVIFADPPKSEDFFKVFDVRKSREITPEVYDFIKDLKVSNVYSNPYIIQKRENLKKKESINETLNKKDE